MTVSAKGIERWAWTRESQGELPRLIRRTAGQIDGAFYSILRWVFSRPTSVAESAS